MDRRTILAGAGSAAAAAWAGCLGNGTSRESTPDPSGCDGGRNEPGPESDRVIDAWSRSDVPPYEIARPSHVDDRTDWNPAHLGANMPTTPSVGFDTHTISRSETDALAPARPSPNRYVVRVIGDTGAAGQLLETRDVNTGESVPVLVGDCCGSSSVELRWGRVEETADGVHIHGYLHQPRITTDDLTSRYSLLEIDRPAEEVDVACVSLTVDRETRVHFDSTDDVVSLVPGVIANRRPDPLAVQLHVSTDDGKTRVDEAFTLEPTGASWSGLGLLGELPETLRVELAVEELGIDVQTHYETERGPLGILILHGGDARIGPSTDL